MRSEHGKRYAVHPDAMALAELEALPVVNKLFGKPARSFVAASGVVWDVGRSGSIWVKCANQDPPAAARGPREARGRA